MPKQHPADALAQDVAQYVESTAEYLAREILGSAVGPATAEIPQAEKLRVLANQVWNPDGTPNQAGRDALVASRGWKGFLDVLTHLESQHARLHADLAEAGGPPPALAPEGGP